MSADVSGRYPDGMAPRAKKAAAPPDPAALKRVSAGRYVTGDERFSVEQGSNGWMVLDAEQTDDFGLPLVRGPFPTLDAAKAALGDARSGPAPTSDLAGRSAPATASGTKGRTSRQPSGGRKASADRAKAAPEPEPEPEPPAQVELRDYRPGDGDQLRALWNDAGFRTTGDDDAGLRMFKARNPRTFLVAVRGKRVVGSAMGAWDGRRGWIYHVAVAEADRRQGLATELVREVERRLANEGCWRVNVLVRDGNADGEKFWRKVGYAPRDGLQFARELADD